MDTINVLLLKISIISGKIKSALKKRLEELDYTSTVLNEIENTPLNGLYRKFAYIYSNISKPIRDSLSENGFGYDEDEFQGLKQTCFGTAYARQLQKQFREEPLTEVTKSILTNNVDLYYLPKIDYSNIQDGSNLFKGCINLMACADINLPNCTNLNNMFDHTESLITLQDFTFNTLNQPWTATYFLNYSLIHNVDVGEILSQGKKIMFKGPYEDEAQEYWDLSGCTNLLGAFGDPLIAGAVCGNLYLPDCVNINLLFLNDSGGRGFSRVGNIYAPNAIQTTIYGIGLWSGGDIGKWFIKADYRNYILPLWTSQKFTSVLLLSGIVNSFQTDGMSAETTCSILDSIYWDIINDEELTPIRGSILEQYEILKLKFVILTISVPQATFEYIENNYPSEKLDVIELYWTIALV